MSPLSMKDSVWARPDNCTCGPFTDLSREFNGKSSALRLSCIERGEARVECIYGFIKGALYLMVQLGSHSRGAI